MLNISNVYRDTNNSCKDCLFFMQRKDKDYCRKEYSERKYNEPIYDNPILK